MGKFPALNIERITIGIDEQNYTPKQLSDLSTLVDVGVFQVHLDFEGRKFVQEVGLKGFLSPLPEHEPELVGIIRITNPFEKAQLIDQLTEYVHKNRQAIWDSLETLQQRFLEETNNE